MVDGIKSSYDVTSLGKASVLAISGSTVRASLFKDPDLSEAIVLSICKYMRQLIDVVESYSVKMPKSLLAERLLSLVESFGEETPDGVLINIKLKQDIVSSMIGVSRQSTNKILKDLQDAGILSVERRFITVLDMDRLQQLSE